MKKQLSTSMNRLRLEQVDALVKAYADVAWRLKPSRGWLKLLREAVGLTERQQAGRLGITGSALHKAEQSEVDERITLGQLRKLADGLDCELVYALVPRRPLAQVVEEQARSVAAQEVEGVAHSMGLEGQRPAASRLKRQIEERAQELLRGRWSALWRYGLYRLPRGAALPRPPPEGLPVVLGQLPPEEPLLDRPPLPADLDPLDEPFDAPPELPRAPLWLPPVPLLIDASLEHLGCYQPRPMSRFAHRNPGCRSTILSA